MRFLRGLLWVTFLTLLVQCSSPIPFGNDTRQYVAEGLSVVQVDSVSFLVNGDEVTNLPSGVPITARIRMINPKESVVTYTLDHGAAGLFAAVPTVPASPSATLVTFDFTLSQMAEHQDLSFELGMSVSATGKSYPPKTFKVLCDSLPHPVGNLVVGHTASQDAFLAFTLPTASSDDDLVSAVLTYQDVQNSTKPGTVVSQTLALDDAALLAVPSPDPLASVSGLKRYFRPPVVSGHAYSFSVTLVDKIGQSSEKQTAGAESVVYTLSYDANGGTGSLPATTAYDYGASATLAGNVLTRVGFVFAGWNTKPDGSGQSFGAGQALAMTLGDLLLYAQWIAVDDVDVTIQWGGAYQSLVMSAAEIIVSVGDAANLAVSFSGGTAWKWYLNGVDQANNAPGFTTPIFSQPGTYYITVTVVKDGVLYSGNMTVIATDGTPIS